MKTCPVCNSKKSKTIIHGFNGHAKHVFNASKDFAYNKCDRCEAVFLSNISVNQSFYKKYYDTEYRTIDSGFLFTAGMFLVSLANKRKIRQIIANTSAYGKISLLDIGSGHGDFLSQLDANRFDPSGIEISKDLVKEAKGKGLHIYTGDFLTYDFGNKKFDCISLWHVIEHIPDPQKLLKKVSTLLKKDGIFIFSTPSTDSLGFKLGEENWFHLEAPRHIILYNQQSLNYLSTTHNFEILHTYNNYLEFPTDLFWSLKNYSRKLRYYVFYPFYKYIDSETITSVWRKK